MPNDLLLVEKSKLQKELTLVFCFCELLAAHRLAGMPSMLHDDGDFVVTPRNLTGLDELLVRRTLLQFCFQRLHDSEVCNIASFSHLYLLHSLLNRQLL